MYDEASWQQFRAECNKYIKDKKEAILKRWLSDIRFDDPIGYSINLSTHIITIYTNHPGMIIGKAGENIVNIEQMLSDEFGGVWKVELVDMTLNGGFVSSVKTIQPDKEYIDRNDAIQRINVLRNTIGFENPAVAIDCIIKLLQNMPTEDMI